MTKKQRAEQIIDLLSNDADGIHIYTMNKPEIAEKIVEFFPDTDIETLETSIQKYKDIDAWNETPVLSKEAFEKLQDVIEEAGELEKRADYTKVVNNKYAKEAVKNK